MKIMNVGGTKVVYHYLSSKLTNIQILTNIGSESEQPEQFGYAHIVEHNIFKGSTKYPGAMDVPTAANDIGGKLNAYTWIDQTVYHITVLNEFFRKGFDILADIYQHPLFPEDEFIKELNPILSEMRRYEDSPESYLANRMMPLMLGDVAGHPVIGNEGSVKAATIENIRAFYEKYYGGQNTMISIVGGVSEQEVISIIEELFAAKPNKEAGKIPVVEYKSGELKLSKAGITEAIYMLAYPALGRFHPDRYKQSLMTYILGGNDSGMLYERIREELGMSCYGIYASSVSFDSHSIIEVSTGIAPEQVEQCHDEVLKQIDRISNELIDDTRLARAKASLRTSIAAASENSGGYNNAIAIPILKGATNDPLNDLLAGIEAVNKNDIMDMAQKTFNAASYRGILLPE